MKRFSRLLLAIATTVTVFAACTKETDAPSNGGVNPKNGFIMKVKTAGAGTKTVITDTDGGNSYGINWSAGDKLGVFEVANGEVQAKAESVGLASEGETATFTFSLLPGSPSGPYKYAFVYPSSALDMETNPDVYYICINQNQTFPLNSFDPAADAMISELVSVNDRPTSVSAKFARIGATARMLIQAPTTSGTIESITFSTTEGEISGYYTMDPATGEVSEDFAVGDNSVILTPSSSTIPYSGEIVVWFRLGSIELTDNFTVKVRTNEHTYTKEVDLATAGRSLAFEDGKMTKFSVDMTAVAGNLNDGDYFITGVKNSQVYASNKYVSGNNLSNPLAITVDEKNGTIEYVSDIEDCIFTFERITTGSYEGKYTIVDADGNYLYAASSSGNQLKGETAPDSVGNAYWDITKNNDGTYAIVSAGTASRNTMRFNSGSTLFSCYDPNNTQNAITLYPASWCTIDTTPVITFEESEKTKNVSASATSVVFYYTANRYATTLPTVSVTSNDDGVIPDTGTPVVVEAGTITVTLVANTETSAKTATLSVSGTGLASDVTLTINQEAASSGAQPSTKTYTLTITSTDLVVLDSSQSSTYNKYKGDQTFTAIATDSSELEVIVNITDVMPATGQNTGKLQIKKSSGVLFNKTDLGTISSISAGVLSQTIGSSQNPSTATTGGAYFKLVNSTGGAAYVDSITITFTK